MQEALHASQTVASEFGHQEITNEHFLIALLDQTDGIVSVLMTYPCAMTCIQVPVSEIAEPMM